jgi:hypothetical protein
MNIMKHKELMVLLGDTSVTELETLLVRLTFHYSLAEHRVRGQVYHEIGHNDVDVPILLDPRTGSVWFLHGQTLSFINSSFQQMLKSIQEVNSWKELPEGLQNEQRAKTSSTALLAIDPSCFEHEDGCWTLIIEQVKNGMI